MTDDARHDDLFDRWYGPRNLGVDRVVRPVNTLLHYIWKMSGRHQIGLCVLAVGVALLGILPIELHRRIIEDGIEARNVDTLTMLGIIYISLLAAIQVSKLALRLYQSWVSESAIYNGRRHLTYLRRKVEEKQNEEGGAAVSIIGQEIDKLGGFVGDGLSGAVSNVAILLGVISYMLYVDPQVAGYALVFLIPQILLTPVIQKRLNRLIARRTEMLRDLGDAVITLDQPKGLPERIDAIYVNRLKFLALKFLMKTLLNVLNAAGPLVVLLYGGYQVIEGETTLGILVAFLTGFEKLSGPIRELISFYRQAAQAAVQHCMIAEWMLPEGESVNGGTSSGASAGP